MDQLKVFLRQCVTYRFWIAVGISLLLPAIGYFVGVGPIVKAKDDMEKSIKTVKADITKYTTPGIVNSQYQPIVQQKNAALTEDIDESWRKLRSLQEPLLRWPEEVEAKFNRWGRAYPTTVDRSEVTRTLIDYTHVYPNFVSKIYQVFRPFNYEDGTGIVVAPDEKTLLRPAPFSDDNPPELSKVWAEQERLWVVTALLDSVAKINDTVKAKDWSGAIVKQLNLVEVGSQSDQDQKSMAEGIPLVPADVLAAPDGSGAPAAAAAAAPPTPGGMAGMMAGMGGPGGPAGPAAATDEVYYIKTDSTKFKSLPFKMVVLVDQNRLPDFLVGLENSPLTIRIDEAELSRPAAAVTKPEIGERTANFGMSGGLAGMMGMGGKMMGGGDDVRGPGGGAGGAAAQNMLRGGGGGGMSPGAMPNTNMSRGGMMGPMGGGGGAASSGTDQRGVNKMQERKDKEKADKSKKNDKPRVETYTNVVEVTVYGQARFYLAPPPKAADGSSPGSVPAAGGAAPAPAAPTPPATPAAPSAAPKAGPPDR